MIFKHRLTTSVVVLVLASRSLSCDSLFPFIAREERNGIDTWIGQLRQPLMVSVPFLLKPSCIHGQILFSSCQVKAPKDKERQ